MPSVSHPDLAAMHDPSALELSFVDYYLSNGRKGAKAWRQAAGEWGTRRRAAYEAATLLRRPYVRATIARADARERRRAEAAADTNRYAVTEDRIMDELASLAFSRPLDLMRIGPDGTAEVDLIDLDHRQAAAIKELTVLERKDGTVKVQVKLVDKLRALTLLGKALGIWDPAPRRNEEPDFGPNAGLSGLLKQAERWAKEKAERGPASTWPSEVLNSFAIP